MTITKQAEILVSKYGYKIDAFQISGKTWQADLHRATTHQPINMQTLINRFQADEYIDAVVAACNDIIARRGNNV